MSMNATRALEPDEPIDELTADYDRTAVADVGAGMLIYGVTTEYRRHLGRETEVARELVAFADVTDWAGIRDALTARGHGVGAVHQLPVIDGGDVPRR